MSAVGPTISATRLKTIGGEKGEKGCERNISLYIITHHQSGRQYVGITAQHPQRRFRKHVSDALRGSQTHLHRAIRKHSPEFFDWHVEAEFVTRDEANSAEISRIAKGPAQFNLAPGGGSCAGIKRSLEVRQRMSAARQGMVFSDAHRAHIGDVQRGISKRPRSAAHAANLSKALAGHSVSAETREKISRQLTGRPGKTPSAETKAKIRAANLGRKPPIFSAEARAKISAKLTGLVRSPETRAKMSAAARSRKRVVK